MQTWDILQILNNPSASAYVARLEVQVNNAGADFDQGVLESLRQMRTAGKVGTFSVHSTPDGTVTVVAEGLAGMPQSLADEPATE